MFEVIESFYCPGKYVIMNEKGCNTYYVDKEGHLTDKWRAENLWDTEKDAKEFERTWSNLQYYKERKQELIESLDYDIQACEKYLKELAEPKIKVGDKFMGRDSGCYYIVTPGNQFVCYSASKANRGFLGHIFADADPYLLHTDVYKRVS